MVTGLPSGTVTFLFTDIEGSTRILRDLGDRYADLLDQHHRLLREVWARHRGVEVLTEGDAFFVAFASATDGLAAAVDGQRALAAATWPSDQPVQVRMGLHAGYARPIDGDYQALAVHQAARIVDAANGGQIMATTEVVALHSGAVPSLELLGRFRIRDFDEPIALYRVSAPGFVSDLRPPRARPADSHNLVRPTTSMVNRVVEQAELADMTQPGRLVTVLGPGGAGKTRLSVEVGLSAVERWPDGVWFVDLAPLSSAEVVPMAIAEAVSAPSVRGNDALSDLIAHLADRSMLLVVDNCEHVIEPAALIAHELLQRCPGVGVLATSRVPLGLIGELLYRLDALGADDIESDAVRLFVERSNAVAGADSVDLADVVRLCRAVDGLPLAIELAATRSHLLTPAEMAERMLGGVAVVATRDPTVPDRQRSLGRLLDWSLDLLGVDELRVLTRLAVVADDFDVALAEVVVADQLVPVESVPDLVWSLIDWSLVVRDVASGGSRYKLMSTVRVHVLDGAADEEVDAARVRLANSLMERLGPGQALSRRWVTAMGIDLENIRAVVHHPSTSDVVARSLAWSIGQYHDVRGSYRSGIAEVGRCLEQRPESGPDLVALLTLQADLHLRLGEVTIATEIVGRAAGLVDQVGVPTWDDMCVVRTSGELALRSDDPETAARLGEDALRAGSATPRGEARVWNLVAIARNTMGDFAAASDALDHCLRAEEIAGLDSFLASTHGNYAEVLLALGDSAGAARHQLASLDLARSMGQAMLIAYSHMIAARFALEDGDADGAVRLQSAADVILVHEGVSLYAGDEELRVSLLDEARQALGDAGFERAHTEGRSIPADQLADQTEAMLQRRAVASTNIGG